MIIINLKGGLGNQMFQYACGQGSFRCAMKKKSSWILRNMREQKIWIRLASIHLSQL